MKDGGEDCDAGLFQSGGILTAHVGKLRESEFRLLTANKSSVLTPCVQYILLQLEKKALLQQSNILTNAVYKSAVMQSIF